MRYFHILIVEDDKDSSELLNWVLGMDNDSYIILTAGTAKETFNLIKGHKIDLYILDYRLPDITGIEICRRIRQSDKETPIIFYSAMAYKADREAGLAAGANEYLVKPNDFDKITGIVEQLLNKNIP